MKFGIMKNATRIRNLNCNKMHFFKSVLLAAAVTIYGTGCAVETYNRVFIAEAAQEFVVSFQVEALLHGHEISIQNLIVKFADITEPRWIGYCWMPNGGTPEVVLSSKYWAGATYYAKEILMFHELGHCLLLKDHIGTFNADGMPASIMYPETFDAYYYERNREQYLTEFFGHAKLEY